MGSLPQDWDSPQVEAQVEDVQRNLAELICTVPEQSGADAICLHLPQFPSHLISCYREARWRLLLGEVGGGVCLFWDEVEEGGVKRGGVLLVSGMLQGSVLV